MNRPTLALLLLAAAFAIIAMFAGSGTVHGQLGTSSDAKADDDIFKDKIVLIEVNSADSDQGNSVVVDHARVVKVGARDFIIGDGFATKESEDAWYEDMLVGVPCESIARFHAMTPERFEEYMKMWKERADEQ
jgi:hypothetical protein